MAFKMLTTPDGLTMAQEQQFESLKARVRELDARLTEIIELCDELMAHNVSVYDCAILDIRNLASGEKV